MSTHEPTEIKNGILPSQWIAAAIASGKINSNAPVDVGQLQPNSLDLRIGNICHRVQCSFLPGHDGIQGKLRRFGWYDAPVDDSGFVLERNHVYLIPVQETLFLPVNVAGRANAKSTMGRLDIFVRLVTEHGTSFDEIPHGYSGRLYLEVVPRSFTVLVRPGDSLAQARFYVGDPTISDNEVRRLMDVHKVVCDPKRGPLDSSQLRVSDGVFLSLSLSPNGTLVGFRAKKNTPPIDLRKVGCASVTGYWDPIMSDVDVPTILEPDEFYIFSSRELVRIPPSICAEMVPFDAGSGELRTHYAGFFDSGFGYSQKEDWLATAASVVLEIRTRDVPFLIEDRHPLFRLLFFRNADVPDRLYGRDLKSNYQGQRLKLSKHFNQNP